MKPAASAISASVASERTSAAQASFSLSSRTNSPIVQPNQRRNACARCTGWTPAPRARSLSANGSANLALELLADPEQPCGRVAVLGVSSPACQRQQLEAETLEDEDGVRVRVGKLLIHAKGETPAFATGKIHRRGQIGRATAESSEAALVYLDDQPPARGGVHFLMGQIARYIEQRRPSSHHIPSSNALLVCAGDDEVEERSGVRVPGQNGAGGIGAFRQRESGYLDSAQCTSVELA